MSVTVYDIAEAAGVSVSTVSRTLRGMSKRETPAQKRILKLSREMGYGKLRGKRGASRQATGQILFIDAAFSDQQLAIEMTHGPIYMAIRDVIEPQGFSLIISSVSGHRPLPPALRSPEMLSGVLTHGPIGHTFYERHLSGLEMVGFQHVNHRLPCSWVATDNHATMMLAVEHLHGLGHRRIGFLTNEIETFHSSQRCAGFRAAMAEFDLPVDERLVVTWQRESVDGVLPRDAALPDFSDRLAPLYASPADAPTAWVGAGDWHVKAIRHFLESRGLRVPQDVSLVGVGHDSLDDAMSRGNLTSVNDRLYEVTATAAQLLLDRLAGKVTHEAVTYIRPTLRPGRSAAQAPV